MKLTELEPLVMHLLFKGYVSLNNLENNVMSMAGWHRNWTCTPTPTLHINYVNACIPLNFLLGFAENFQKVMMNVKQELVLTRSRNDNNLYKGGANYI